MCSLINDGELANVLLEVLNLDDQRVDHGDDNEQEQRSSGDHLYDDDQQVAINASKPQLPKTEEVAKYKDDQENI